MSNDDINLYDFIALYSLKILFECVVPFNPHSSLMRWVVSLSYKWGSLNLRFVWDHASHMLRPEAGQLQGLSSLSTLYPCLFLASAPSAVISTDIPVSFITFMCGFTLNWDIKKVNMSHQVFGSNYQFAGGKGQNLLNFPVSMQLAKCWQ